MICAQNATEITGSTYTKWSVLSTLNKKSGLQGVKSILILNNIGECGDVRVLVAHATS